MPFLERLPHPLQSVAEWLVDPVVLAVLGVGSLALFVLGAVGAPWFIARVPADYFSRREQARLGIVRRRSPARIVVVVLRNLLGLGLLIAGFAMLFLPGQGLLTMLVGLLLLDFPGKRRLQRRVLSSPRVDAAITALRRRAGREPLDLGDPGGDDDHRDP